MSNKILWNGVSWSQKSHMILPYTSWLIRCGILAQISYRSYSFAARNISQTSFYPIVDSTIFAPDREKNSGSTIRGFLEDAMHTHMTLHGLSASIRPNGSENMCESLMCGRHRPDGMCCAYCIYIHVGNSGHITGTTKKRYFQIHVYTFTRQINYEIDKTFFWSFFRSTTIINITIYIASTRVYMGIVVFIQWTIREIGFQHKRKPNFVSILLDSRNIIDEILLIILVIIIMIKINGNGIFWENELCIYIIHIPWIYY